MKTRPSKKPGGDDRERIEAEVVVATVEIGRAHV
jgi:hypothetical protein